MVEALNADHDDCKKGNPALEIEDGFVGHASTGRVPPHPVEQAVGVQRTAEHPDDQLRQAHVHDEQVPGRVPQAGVHRYGDDLTEVWQTNPQSEQDVQDGQADVPLGDGFVGNNQRLQQQRGVEATPTQHRRNDVIHL